jgi:hypothetical protein
MIVIIHTFHTITIDTITVHTMTMNLAYYIINPLIYLRFELS